MIFSRSTVNGTRRELLTFEVDTSKVGKTADFPPDFTCKPSAEYLSKLVDSASHTCSHHVASLTSCSTKRLPDSFVHAYLCQSPRSIIWYLPPKGVEALQLEM